MSKAEYDGDSEGKLVVMKVLVVKDSKSKSVFAHLVPSKGVYETQYALDRLVEDI